MKEYRIGKTLYIWKYGKWKPLNVFVEQKQYVYDKPQILYEDMNRSFWKPNNHTFAAVFEKAFDPELDCYQLWSWHQTKQYERPVAALSVEIWDWDWEEWKKFATKHKALQISKNPYARQETSLPKTYNNEIIRANIPETITLTDSAGESFSALLSRNDSIVFDDTSE